VQGYARYAEFIHVSSICCWSFDLLILILLIEKILSVLNITDRVQPNIMYEKGHPVWPKLQEIGREITQKVKPKAIVVFSAHWQGSQDTIEINTSENTDLIYESVPLYKTVAFHR
jgi:aromatic ring-opening dioxygenase catalytic subunit (LigB family)